MRRRLSCLSIIALPFPDLGAVRLGITRSFGSLRLIYSEKGGMRVRDLDKEEAKKFAEILIKTPSVGPETAKTLLATYDALMKHKHAVGVRGKNRVIVRELERYADALWTVSEFFALHQKIVIKQFENLIRGRQSWK